MWSLGDQKYFINTVDTGRSVKAQLSLVGQVNPFVPVFHTLIRHYQLVVVRHDVTERRYNTTFSYDVERL